jgi:hypothetical protein
MLMPGQCSKEEYARASAFVFRELIRFPAFGHHEYKGKQKEIVEAAVLGMS